jgi:pilus assembly protein CpaC
MQPVPAAAMMAALLMLWAPTPAQAQGIGSLVLSAGSGRVLRLHGRATSVFAADPKVAEVRPASATSLFVFGVGPGHTTIAALNAAGAAVGDYDVTVEPSDYAAKRTRAALAGDEDDAGLTATQTEGGVALDGTAASPDGAAHALADAADAAGKTGTVDDRMTVAGSVQVGLHVRIAEMSRALTREIGVNWQSVNGLGTNAAYGISTGNALATLTTLQSVLSLKSKTNVFGHTLTLDTLIDALSQDALIHMLAEPNLTTMSGEPASFLVGGEFPIPVSNQNNDITVSFKQYGISLAFVPTVLSNGRINLHVRPEVSELSNQGAVSIGGSNNAISIPALTVRRAETTVELGSGQSFAIAGLLEDDTTNTGLGLPFAGDVPVLGALFRSSSFQHNQTELVIVVTPYIVRPVDTPAALSLPTDSNRPPNDLERILLLREVARGGTPDHRPIPGDAGFVLE